MQVGVLRRDRKKEPEPRTSQGHPLHIENSGEGKDWGTQLGPGFFRERMKHLLSGLRNTWAVCAIWCWQQTRNTWIETPLYSVHWNQSSSSGSKGFLDHSGKHINTELVSCKGDRTEWVALNFLLLQCRQSGSEVLMPWGWISSANRACFFKRAWGPHCSHVAYNRPELRFQASPSGMCSPISLWAGKRSCRGRTRGSTVTIYKMVW